MAFVLQTPIVQPFVLYEIDPSGEAKVFFRQVSTAETQVRDQLVFSGQARTMTDSGVTVERTLPWSLREEIEVRLTLCGAEGIFLSDGKTPLFRFKNDTLSMNPDQFHEAWGKLPSPVASIIHEKCLDANPDWDWRSNPTPVVPSLPEQNGEESEAEETN